MFTNAIGTGSFSVDVATSNDGGHPPEFWAKRAADRIVSISDSTDPNIAAQARVFRDQVEQVILFHMKQAISCDRTTVGQVITKAGHPELAEHIRRP
jgi:hypothetical protein